jgi:hypothetical protein
VRERGVTTGSYSVEAIFDNSKEIMASDSGTYTFDSKAINYRDKK